MKSLLFAALLFLCIASNAVTDNPDGSVTFTHEEGVALLANIHELETTIQQYEADREKIRVIFFRQQKKIDELEKRTCT